MIGGQVSSIRPQIILYIYSDRSDHCYPCCAIAIDQLDWIAGYLDFWNIPKTLVHQVLDFNFQLWCYTFEALLAYNSIYS